MAQATKRRRPSSSRNGRSASRKTEKYRFAQNVNGEGTVAEREYQRYAAAGREDPGAEPDVLLDVPVVKVDSIHLELDDLDAHVALKAQVLDLVTLNVGVDVHLGKVRLDIKGVEAQALLKVRLDHVVAVVDRVLTTIDRNPELVKSLGKAVEDVGSGAGHTLGETGEAVDEIGEGAGQAVDDVGQGAGQAVGEVGAGAGEAVGQIGEGARQAAGDVGQGAGQAVGSLDQVVGGVGQAAGQLGDGAGQAVGQLAQGAGGPGEASGGSPGQLAKEMAKTVAKEIGSAAADEAKDVSVAATRKVQELGERRRQRRAEKVGATEAAVRIASELDVDLDEVEGTGADGRITVKDVRNAQEG
jgi:hypothetical protein